MFLNHKTRPIPGIEKGAFHEFGNFVSYQVRKCDMLCTIIRQPVSLIITANDCNFMPWQSFVDDSTDNRQEIANAAPERR